MELVDDRGVSGAARERVVEVEVCLRESLERADVRAHALEGRPQLDSRSDAPTREPRAGRRRSQARAQFEQVGGVVLADEKAPAQRLRQQLAGRSRR